MTDVIVSDLEGTLTAGESWKGVARYLKTHGRAAQYRWFFLKHLPEALLAKGRLIDVQRFKDRWQVDMSRLFSGFTVDELSRMGEWVVEHELWPQRRRAVLAEIAALGAAGHRLVLASGTYQPVLEAFARRTGAEALGTLLEVADGLATGRLTGWVNVGRAKAERLTGWLAERSASIRAAYGDTAADLPMLALSAYPVAVCPDARLAREAARLGWRVLTDDRPAR